MQWWEFTGYFILVLNIFIGISIVFWQQKSETATWAWLMILFFLPVVGFVLYVLFGRELSNSKWIENHHSHTKEVLTHQQETSASGHFYQPIPKLEKHRGIIDLHLHNNHSPLSYNNEVTLITDGKQKFQEMFADMKNAEQSIYVEYFGIGKDEVGKEMINILTEKAKEGLEVLLLYDGVGSYKMSRKFLKEFLIAGGRAEVFFPLHTVVTKANFNHRNHRKIAVIDCEIGYTGGFNVGVEYQYPSKKMGYWRDTHLRLTGSSVDLLTDHFLSDWSKGNPEKVRTLKNRKLPEPSEEGTAMQLVHSGPDVEGDQIQRGFLKMIQDAERYIYIQTPYFIPTSSLLESLRIAALSGVKVKIMIPDKPDHMFVYWATSYYAGELLKAGAEIFIYEGGFLHAKTIVADDEISTVGTTNVDVRSVSLNFELNVFMYGSKQAIRSREIFEQDIRSSRELTWEEYQNRPITVQIKETFSRLLSPLL